MEQNPNFLVEFESYSYKEYELFNFLKKRWDQGVNVYKDEYECLVEIKQLIRFMEEKLPEFKIQQSSFGTIFESASCFIMCKKSNDDVFEFSIYALKDELSRVSNLIKENFEKVGPTIEWIYNQGGDSVTLPVNSGNLPIDEFYPFLNGRTLEEYYDSYLNSRASILILLGPPGTGKTTFLRGLIHHSNSNATVTYDPKILENDRFFAEFISGREDDSRFLILEDSDNLLIPRKNGNPLMMKFLNVGDGLVSGSKMKLIFTTNLPNVQSMDEALTRPGRCFDILEFSALTPEQSERIAIKMNIQHEPFINDLNLSEIFNQSKNTKRPKHSVGFIH